MALLKLLSNNMHENNQYLLYKDEIYVKIPYAIFFEGNRTLFASMLEKKFILDFGTCAKIMLVFTF